MTKLLYNSDIYSPTKQDIEDYKEALELNGLPVPEEIPDDDLYQFLQDSKDLEWDAFISDISLYERAHGAKTYVVLADLGLWYGHVPSGGGKIITGLNNIWPQTFEDRNMVYLENGRLTISATHHDGTNRFQVRELTEQGKRYIKNHSDMDDKALHFKLFFNSHYSHNVRIFKEIHG